MEDRFQRQAAMTQAEFRATMARAGERLDRALKEAGAAPGESLYSARRRNFAAASAAARERDRRHELRQIARAAADKLWIAGAQVYEDNGCWRVFHDGRAFEASDQDLIDFETTLGRRAA
jgi:hypothetical protein